MTHEWRDVTPGPARGPADKTPPLAEAKPLAPGQRRCAWASCQRSFTPTRGQDYCGKDCRRAARRIALARLMAG